MTADAGPARESDIDIARRTRAALTRRLGCLIGSTEVTVLNGVVEIRGELENGDQKSIAEQTISGLTGVRMVINRLRVSPPSKLAMRTLFR